MKPRRCREPRTPLYRMRAVSGINMARWSSFDPVAMARSTRDLRPVQRDRERRPHLGRTDADRVALPSVRITVMSDTPTNVQSRIFC
jgi:hypothetical protein